MNQKAQDNQTHEDKPTPQTSFDRFKRATADLQDDLRKTDTYRGNRLASAVGNVISDIEGLYHDIDVQKADDARIKAGMDQATATTHNLTATQKQRNDADKAGASGNPVGEKVSAKDDYEVNVVKADTSQAGTNATGVFGAGSADPTSADADPQVKEFDSALAKELDKKPDAASPSHFQELDDHAAKQEGNRTKSKK